MESEHAFQQSGFLVAFQLMVISSLLAPGVLGGGDLVCRIVGAIASSVLTFGPMAILVYVLYRVLKLS